MRARPAQLLGRPGPLVLDRIGQQHEEPPPCRARLTKNPAVGQVRSESKLRLDPIVTFLSVGYTFRPVS
ncbi:hypothetical protein GCT13_43335 [Paraburkholderia sp. CNPSo 3157]|uniref:Uncharacterized protein n=1 Tax=Paraburkholderia franconis TaxID=2654983 RepID=A0A7X1NK42_9BURK|nr:hypothetical protein [Paraburkholderia franconis]